jgi:hypothetical protein
MGPFVKFDLIKNHGLRSDQPNRETNHQRAERERSGADDGWRNGATR